MPWVVVGKFTPAAARLTDGHYSRRKVGSPQFMPPGQTLILMTPDERAVFGWWRPHPRSGIRAMNGLDGWTCTIFRNTGPNLSSELILAAESELAARYDCGPSGLLTYVWDAKVASRNPGYCFKVAGWKAIGRSADGRKTLLTKPFALAARLQAAEGSEACSCGVINLNTSGDSGARDWHADCPVHGEGTDWYESGGRAYHEAMRAYSVDLQRRAREARNTGIPGTVPPPPRFEDFVPAAPPEPAPDAP